MMSILLLQKTTEVATDSAASTSEPINVQEVETEITLPPTTDDALENFLKPKKSNTTPAKKEDLRTTTTSPIAEVKVNRFKPNPTFEDYLRTER